MGLLSSLSSVCKHNKFGTVTFVLVDWSFWNFNTMILGTE